MRIRSGSLLCLLLFCLSTSVFAESPPNILLMTIDNVGYGDLPTYNADSPIKTPRIDQLAAEGARFTQFYTASSTCTVSRACLLTGRVAQRHGLINQLPGVAGNYGVGLDQRERLIPQYLKSAPTPYVTGCFGKWNIGFAPGSRPTERGFDEFIGHASGNIDYYHHHYADVHDLFEGIEHLHREGEYATDLFADAAISFIKRKSADKAAPWFCYLPFNAPHFPMKKNKRPGEPVEWQAPDWAFAEYGLSPDEPDYTKRFYATMTALDRAIGRVLDSLEEAGVAKNTFVFLMSDNGAFTQLSREGLDVGSNAPLHDGGITCWEGGIRVPAFVRWPDHVEAGSIVDAICWSPDLLVTSLALAEATLPDNVVLDGEDILPVLIDKSPTPHESLYFDFRGHAAVRMGDWKIVREKPPNPWMLFNLAEDIGEQHDVAAEEPEKLKQLTAEFDRWQADIAESNAPVTFLDFIKRRAAELRRDDEPPTTLAAWNDRKAKLRDQLQSAWGEFPDELCPLEPKILGTLERDGYRIEKLIFQTLPGVWMTANAYVPEGDGPFAAVLCVHGHWRGAKQDPNVTARCVGLAKLGFLVLGVDAFGAGERGIGKALGEYHGEMTAATLLPIGRPLSGIQVYENQRAVDYLQSRPDVDGQRLGITGASGGGNQTMYAGAWDERFSAAVPVCSVGNYQAYLGAACCMCEVVPGALTFTEEWGVLSLTAPRGLMVINATKDAPQFSVAEARKSLANTKEIYEVIGETEDMRHSTFVSPHAYNQPMREAMYGWMTRHLKGQGDGSPIAEPEMTLDEPEALRCYPGESRPDDWMTLTQFAARQGRELVERQSMPTNADDWKSAAVELRQQLDRDVLGGTMPDVKLVSSGTAASPTVVFSPEPDIQLTLRSHRPQGFENPQRVLILDCDGTDSAAVKQAIGEVNAAGQTALTLTLRATGELAYARDKIGRAPDHNTAEWSLWIGRPLLGQWVVDVRGALDAMEQIEGESTLLHVIGIGPAGVVALCAAALDERITHAGTIGTLASYISEVPYEGQRLGIMAPGIVRDVGDISTLASLLAPRRLTIAGSIDGSGNVLNIELQTEVFRQTQDAFSRNDVPQALSLLPTSSVADIIRGWESAQ